jgi:hypothetical protein
MSPSTLSCALYIGLCIGFSVSLFVVFTYFLGLNLGSETGHTGGVRGFTQFLQHVEIAP